METTTISTTQLWTGRILSGLVVLFMLFDAVLKFMKPDVVIKTTVVELGYEEHHILVHGCLALFATILYTVPRTSLLGAIVLSAHFGGAIASHLRVDNPLASHTLFPVYIGILTWLGLWLRNAQVRKILPFTKEL